MRRPWSMRSRNGSDDILLRWSPRVRQNGGLLNGIELDIDQPWERYEIDVMNGADRGPHRGADGSARVDLQRSHPRR